MIKRCLFKPLWKSVLYFDLVLKLYILKYLSMIASLRLLKVGSLGSAPISTSLPNIYFIAEDYPSWAFDFSPPAMDTKCPLVCLGLSPWFVIINLVKGLVPGGCGFITAWLQLHLKSWLISYLKKILFDFLIQSFQFNILVNFEAFLNYGGNFGVPCLVLCHYPC